MCVYARYALRASRCTASTNQFHEGLRRVRSTCRSTMLWSQVPSPPGRLWATGAVAQPVPSGADLRYRSISQTGQSSLSGLISDGIATFGLGSCAFAACGLEAPKVWVLIQDVRHRSLADAVNRCLAALMVDGAAVLPQPVQVAQDGPLVDEIRYFKAGDRTGALAIVQALKKVLPRLWLRDLSAEYDRVVWVEHGHYELWLAPGERPKDH
jgi:hypothetical protein